MPNGYVYPTADFPFGGYEGWADQDGGTSDLFAILANHADPPSQTVFVKTPDDSAIQNDGAFMDFTMEDIDPDNLVLGAKVVMTAKLTAANVVSDKYIIYVNIGVGRQGAVGQFAFMFDVGGNTSIVCGSFPPTFTLNSNPSFPGYTADCDTPLTNAWVTYEFPLSQEMIDLIKAHPTGLWAEIGYNNGDTFDTPNTRMEISQFYLFDGTGQVVWTQAARPTGSWVQV